MKENLNIYNEYVGTYTDYMLVLPERKILEKLKDQWKNIRMMDIGVGTGRTSFTFSAIVKDYTGIDYSPTMIEKCKNYIGENNRTRFILQDATDLSDYYDKKYDFVLFSMNGIDSVDSDDRKKILLEVHNVLEDDGLFYFSTHSLHTFPDSFPFKISFPEFDKRKPLHFIYQCWKTMWHKFKMWKIYRGINIQKVQEKPWAVLVTGDHDFKIMIYHIRPDYQVEELEDAGFEVMCVYDEKGIKRDPMKERINGYIYFLCKKRN